MAPQMLGPGEEPGTGVQKQHPGRRTHSHSEMASVPEVLPDLEPHLQTQHLLAPGIGYCKQWQRNYICEGSGKRIKGCSDILLPSSYGSRGERLPSRDTHVVTLVSQSRVLDIFLN